MQAALGALFQVANEILRPERPTAAGCFTDSLRHGFFGNAGFQSPIQKPNRARTVSPGLFFTCTSS
jgi:hypothetical protein